MSGTVALLLRAARGAWAVEHAGTHLLARTGSSSICTCSHASDSGPCSSSSGSQAWRQWGGAPRYLHVQTEQPQQEQRRGAHQLEVSIKAFERRYLDQASTTIRDLMFINFAPKSTSLLPSASPDAPVNLFMPIRERRVPQNWKRTRFTVVRGPHIDKIGREQFEMRSYKTVLEAETHDAQEVQWFLDSVRFYDFPGVQIQVQLTSSTFLTPTPLPSAAQEGSLLAEHRSRIARYLLPAASASAPAVPDPKQQLLHALRQAIFAGLHAQRKDLAGTDSYKRWFERAKLETSRNKSAPAPEGVAAGSEQPAVDALLADKLQQLAAVATSTDPSVPQASKTAAFLAAVDAVFLTLNLGAAEAHKHFTYHFATYQVGQKVRQARWHAPCMRTGVEDVLGAVLVLHACTAAIAYFHTCSAMFATQGTHSLHGCAVLQLRVDHQHRDAWQPA